MLSNTSCGELEKFFGRFKVINYHKRDIVLQAEEKSNFVFYIKSGYVRVFRVSQQGEELTLIILKSGDFFPFLWKIDEIPSNFYLEAITSLEVARLPQKEFTQFLESHPRVFNGLVNHLLVRFSGLLTRIEYLVFGNAYCKVASTILVCANCFGTHQGKDVVLDLPLTHKDIANLVGITRETTCLEMKKLERKGLLYHRGRSLVVSDIERLEKESLLSSNKLELSNSL